MEIKEKGRYTIINVNEVKDCSKLSASSMILFSTILILSWTWSRPWEGCVIGYWNLIVVLAYFVVVFVYLPIFGLTYYIIGKLIIMSLNLKIFISTFLLLLWTMIIPFIMITFKFSKIFHSKKYDQSNFEFTSNLK